MDKKMNKEREKEIKDFYDLAKKYGFYSVDRE